MKICLASIPVEHAEKSLSNVFAPLSSLPSLAGVILNNGMFCDIIDARYVGVGREEFIETLRKGKYDLLGITLCTQDIDRANELAGKIKRTIDGLQIIVGGPHISALPKETLSDYPNFDFGVYGEGEITIVEFMKYFHKPEKYKEINGLVFREGEEVIVTSPREFIENLDDLPLPRYDLLPKAREYAIQTHRGCPYSCCFCYRALGKKVRLRSPAAIVKEIEYVLSLSAANRFGFADSTFAVVENHAHELLDLMIEKGINKRAAWSTQTRVSIANRALLEKMREAGCDTIGFGFESGDDEILKMTGKNTTTDEGFRCVKAAKELGFAIRGYFIMGHPNETKKAIRKTIHYAADLNLDLVTFGIMVPWPGTKVYKWAQEGESGYKLIEGNNFTHYHKHFGEALYFENFSITFLEWMRIWGYITVYIKNNRWMELLKFFCSNFKPSVLLLRNLLMKVKRSSLGGEL